MISINGLRGASGYESYFGFFGLILAVVLLIAGLRALAGSSHRLISTAATGLFALIIIGLKCMDGQLPFCR